MHDFIRMVLCICADEILQDTGRKESVLLIYCDCGVVLWVESADGGECQWSCVGLGNILEDVDICVSWLFWVGVNIY